MSRKTPGGVRLVEVVLEDEVPGIRPVVRDVAPIVVAHDIGIRRALGADRVVGILLASPAPCDLRLSDEAVHLAPVDVGDRIRGAVRAAGVEIVRVVKRLLASTLQRIGDADCELAVRVAWQTVSPGIRAEVLIEGPVLLHDHDDVLDLVDRNRRLWRHALRPCIERGGGENRGKPGPQERDRDERASHDPPCLDRRFVAARL
jgi:hypothetical protein